MTTTIETLKAIETPVLIAWARRCVDQAKEAVRAELSATDPTFPGKSLEELWVSLQGHPSKLRDRLYYGAKHLADAVDHLSAAEGHRGPAVRVSDPEDGGTVTFSRESKVSNAVAAAARTIALVSVRPDGVSTDSHATMIEAGMHADLTRNLGVDTMVD